MQHQNQMLGNLHVNWAEDSERSKSLDSDRHRSLDSGYFQGEVNPRGTTVPSRRHTNVIQQASSSIAESPSIESEALSFSPLAQGAFKYPEILPKPYFSDVSDTAPRAALKISERQERIKAMLRELTPAAHLRQQPEPEKSDSKYTESEIRVREDTWKLPAPGDPIVNNLPPSQIIHTPLEQYSQSLLGTPISVKPSASYPQPTALTFSPVTDAVSSTPLPHQEGQPPFVTSYRGSSGHKDVVPPSASPPSASTYWSGSVSPMAYGAMHTPQQTGYNASVKQGPLQPTSSVPQRHIHHRHTTSPNTSSGVLTADQALTPSSEPPRPKSASSPAAEFHFGKQQVLVHGPPMVQHLEIHPDGSLTTSHTPVGQQSRFDQHISPQQRLSSPLVDTAGMTQAHNLPMYYSETQVNLKYKRAKRLLQAQVQENVSLRQKLSLEERRSSFLEAKLQGFNSPADFAQLLTSTQGLAKQLNESQEHVQALQGLVSAAVTEKTQLLDEQDYQRLKQESDTRAIRESLEKQLTVLNEKISSLQSASESYKIREAELRSQTLKTHTRLLEAQRRVSELESLRAQNDLDTQALRHKLSSYEQEETTAFSNRHEASSLIEVATQKLLQQHEAALNDVKASHHAAFEEQGHHLKNLSKTSQRDALAASEMVHQEAMAAVEKLHQEQLAAAEKQHHEALEMLKSNHDYALQQLKEDLSESKRLHQEQLAVAEKHHQEELDMFNSSHDHALQQLKEELSESKRLHQEQLAAADIGHQEALELLKLSHDHALQQHTEALIKSEEPSEEQLEAVEKLHQEQLVSADKFYREALEALEASHNQASQQQKQELATTKKRHQEALEVLQLSHDQVLQSLRQELQEDYEKRLQWQDAQHLKVVEKLELDLEQQLELAERRKHLLDSELKEGAAAQSLFEQALEALSAQHVLVLEQHKISYKEKLQRKLLRRLQAQALEHEQDIEQLRITLLEHPQHYRASDWEAQLEDLKQQLSEKSVELASAQEQCQVSEGRLKSKRAEYRQRLLISQKDLEACRKDLGESQKNLEVAERAFTDLQRLTEENLKVQKDAMKEDYRQQLSECYNDLEISQSEVRELQQHKEETDLQMRILQERLNQQLQSQVESLEALQSAHEQSMLQLHLVGQEAMQKLQKSHQQEKLQQQSDNNRMTLIEEELEVCREQVQSRTLELQELRSKFTQALRALESKSEDMISGMQLAYEERLRMLLQQLTHYDNKVAKVRAVAKAVVDAQTAVDNMIMELDQLNDSDLKGLMGSEQARKELQEALRLVEMERASLQDQLKACNLEKEHLYLQNKELVLQLSQELEAGSHVFEGQRDLTDKAEEKILEAEEKVRTAETLAKEAEERARAAETLAKETKVQLDVTNEKAKQHELSAKDLWIQLQTQGLEMQALQSDLDATMQDAEQCALQLSHAQKQQGMDRDQLALAQAQLMKLKQGIRQREQDLESAAKDLQILHGRLRTAEIKEAAAKSCQDEAENALREAQAAANSYKDEAAQALCEAQAAANSYKDEAAQALREAQAAANSYKDEAMQTLHEVQVKYQLAVQRAEIAEAISLDVSAHLDGLRMEMLQIKDSLSLHEQYASSELRSVATECLSQQAVLRHQFDQLKHYSDPLLWNSLKGAPQKQEDMEPKPTNLKPGAADKVTSSEEHLGIGQQDTSGIIKLYAGDSRDTNLSALKHSADIIDSDDNRFLGLSEGALALSGYEKKSAVVPDHTQDQNIASKLTLLTSASSQRWTDNQRGEALNLTAPTSSPPMPRKWPMHLPMETPLPWNLTEQQPVSADRKSHLDHEAEGIVGALTFPHFEDELNAHEGSDNLFPNQTRWMQPALVNDRVPSSVANYFMDSITSAQGNSSLGEESHNLHPHNQERYQSPHALRNQGSKDKINEGSDRIYPNIKESNRIWHQNPHQDDRDMMKNAFGPLQGFHLQTDPSPNRQKIGTGRTGESPTPLFYNDLGISRATGRETAIMIAMPESEESRRHQEVVASGGGRVMSGPSYDLLDGSSRAQVTLSSSRGSVAVATAMTTSSQAARQTPLWTLEVEGRVGEGEGAGAFNFQMAPSNLINSSNEKLLMKYVNSNGSSPVVVRELPQSDHASHALVSGAHLLTKLNERKARRELRMQRPPTSQGLRSPPRSSDQNTLQMHLDVSLQSDIGHVHILGPEFSLIKGDPEFSRPDLKSMSHQSLLTHPRESHMNSIQQKSAVSRPRLQEHQNPPLSSSYTAAFLKQKQNSINTNSKTSVRKI